MRVLRGTVARDQRRKRARRLHRIVHAGEQDVLERDAALRALDVARRRRQDFLDAPLSIDRHDSRTRRIVRGVQRDREVDRESFLAERVDPRNDAAG